MTKNNHRVRIWLTFCSRRSVLYVVFMAIKGYFKVKQWNLAEIIEKRQNFGEFSSVDVSCVSRHEKENLTMGWRAIPLNLNTIYGYFKGNKGSVSEDNNGNWLWFSQLFSVWVLLYLLRGTLEMAYYWKLTTLFQGYFKVNRT